MQDKKSKVKNCCIVEFADWCKIIGLDPGEEWEEFLDTYKTNIHCAVPFKCSLDLDYEQSDSEHNFFLKTMKEMQKLKLKTLWIEVQD